ncbi:MAG TPA: molybdenum cofactor biosynthesis protein MoaE [Puia sp.]|nr:molybdenum cofactor biosynthesis protein MoaE [Puia sp.]
MERNPKNIFVQGPIQPVFIGERIADHAAKKNIGAHNIFLGQIRRDMINGRQVREIDYTAYEEMALEKMHVIRESVFSRFALECLHVYHSLGIVKAGEISLFVFTSSMHRRDATAACSEIVERIKAELPVWGREIFEDETHQWKQNS